MVAGKGWSGRFPAYPSMSAWRIMTAMNLFSWPTRYET